MCAWTIACIDRRKAQSFILLFAHQLQDERLWMGIHKTDSGRFLVVNLGGKQQNESWVLDLEGALR